MSVASDERTHLSEAVAREILEAWFSAQVDESERENIERVRALDRGRGTP